MNGSENKALSRLLRLLALGPGSVREAAAAGRVVIETARGSAAIAAGALEAMASRGLIGREDAAVVLTDAGRAWLKRMTAGDEPFGAQHRELERASIETPAGWRTVTVNRAESPLGKLAGRLGKDGRPFLAEGEFQAGERLRADYTQGQIMPRLGANWQAAVASGRRSGGTHGAVELTHAALAARQRVERAIEAVGPELGGLLLDICCFLKGLEQVERERGWPVRSAKVMFKAGLGVLHRHYSPASRRKDRHGATILHWGADDYRPEMTGPDGRGPG